MAGGERAGVCVWRKMGRYWVYVWERRLSVCLCVGWGGGGGVSLGKTRFGLRLLRASTLHSTQQDTEK